MDSLTTTIAYVYAVCATAAECLLRAGSIRFCFFDDAPAWKETAATMSMDVTSSTTTIIPPRWVGKCSRRAAEWIIVKCLLSDIDYRLKYFCFLTHIFYFSLPASGQAVVTGVVPSPRPPRFLPSFFIAHRVHQQSRCSSIFHRVLLTHALALSASQFVRKKKSPQIYTSSLICTRGDSISRN